MPGADMMMLSIVVPVYKVEQYVEKCITSILGNQLFENHCELIVVDDGSPDASMAIVERLCAGRPNVTLVRQVNQGLGMARNAGVARARGAYFWFVDSDDWLTPYALEKLISLIETSEPDVVNIDHVMSDGRTTPIANHARHATAYSGAAYLQLSCVQNEVPYYIYRAAFYRGCELHFERDIYHEDALFTPSALILAQRVVRLAEPCYVYNVREGSIMTSGNHLKHARDMLTVVEKLEAFRLRHVPGGRQARVFSRYIALAVGGVFYYWKRLDRQERNLVRAEMDMRGLLSPILRSGSLKYLVAVALMFSHRRWRLDRF